ncbi:uncharacterized protein K452DRAFT_284377 [Aplosporella prunicola CBS 121167]|uniref:C2H2-type domain-containing protein n=1 Tax=Aplosporella prunicola CBS 121167 TaxID=1176127 RepID=A0A6A6BLS5_9PEZI|nr:uncharacterized protein K452DRAFT_284377 [Aplosporella prunicola CBS 121167]KAF2144986.1 hypothetical protein K452DRAFT_284377 [Aplosporella prunicola CBS 121167]
MTERILASDSEPESETIADVVTKLFQQFNGLGTQLHHADQDYTNQVQRSEVADEAGRFRTWAGNIGAHRRGRSSLDYRLRDASHIEHKVHTLLRRLDSLLVRCIAIVTGEVIPWDKRPLESSSDSDSSDPENEDLQDNTELRQLMTSTHDTTTMLLRLTMAIQNPAPHDQIMNSADADTSFYTPYDIFHVKSKLATATDDIADRLGKAISRRRQFFKYRELHHQKLAYGIQRSLGQVSTEETKTEHQPPTTIASSLPGNVKLSAHPAALNLSYDERPESGLTQTSFATSADEGDEKILKIPLLPAVGQNGDPFECPYCFTMISIRSNLSWKRHIHNDLRPYVCTFSDCPTPNRLYERRHEWYEHELQIHQRTWRCSNDECAMLFQSLSEFEDHVMNTHNTVNSSENFAAGAELPNKWPIAPVTECHLCGQTRIPFSRLQKHLGGHQEQLALFALPSLPESSGNEADTKSESSNSINNQSDDNSSGESKKSDKLPPDPSSEGLKTLDRKLQPYLPRNEGEIFRRHTEQKREPPLLEPLSTDPGSERAELEKELKKIETEKAAAEEAAKAPPPPEPPKPPIKFKDAVGRKFSFPWNFCKTRKGMEDLIKQAFLHVDVIGREVQEGHYDLVGPDGEIILAQNWEAVVQPDMAITMHMWPMEELPQPEPVPPPPPPPRLRHISSYFGMDFGFPRHLGGPLPNKEKKKKSLKQTDPIAVPPPPPPPPIVGVTNPNVAEPPTTLPMVDTLTHVKPKMKPITRKKAPLRGFLRWTAGQSSRPSGKGLKEDEEAVGACSQSSESHDAVLSTLRDNSTVDSATGDRSEDWTSFTEDWPHSIEDAEPERSGRAGKQAEEDIDYTSSIRMENEWREYGGDYLPPSP